MDFICPEHEGELVAEASLDRTDDGEPMQGHRFECPEDDCEHTEIVLVLQYPNAEYEGVMLAPTNALCEECGEPAEFCLERSGQYPRYRCREHTSDIFADEMRSVALELGV